METTEYPKENFDTEIFSPEHKFDEEITDLTEKAEYLDPLVDAFEKAGMPLSENLTHMLQETSEYRFGYDTWDNHRRGSGFTTATREIAQIVEEYRDKKKDIAKKIFDRAKMIEQQFPLYLTKQITEGKIENEAQTIEANIQFEMNFRLTDHIDKQRIKQITQTVEGEGLRLIAKMIADAIDPLTPEKNPEAIFLPSYQGDKKVGTCTTAETYFLQAEEDLRLREIDRGHSKKMNVIIDEKGEPVLIEKLGLGENSALTLKEVVVDGMTIPPGGLVYVEYDREQKRRVVNLHECTGFQFLRLTTLAVSPGKEREKAFGTHLEFQKRNSMPGYNTTSIDDFRVFAKALLQAHSGSGIGKLLKFLKG